MNRSAWKDRKKDYCLILFLSFFAVACAPETTPTPTPEPTIAIVESTIELPPIVTVAASEPTITPTTTAVPEPEKERVVAVLLGGDWENARPERVQFGIRTDVILLVIMDHWDEPAYDRPNLRITLVSIPRDLFIRVPCSETYDDVDPMDEEIGFEFGKDRANAAWWYGNFACVSDMMALNFGYSPDYHAFVDFDGFMEVVDIFGGLYITPNKTYA
ncbi:hypothetical protein LCGC14_1735570, partial [marine sediment metagenome]